MGTALGARAQDPVWLETDSEKLLKGDPSIDWPFFFIWQSLVTCQSIMPPEQPPDLMDRITNLALGLSFLEPDLQDTMEKQPLVLPIQ